MRNIYEDIEGYINDKLRRKGIRLMNSKLTKELKHKTETIDTTVYTLITTNIWEPTYLTVYTSIPIKI